MLEGDWSLALKLEQAGEVVGSFSVTRKGEWLTVESDDEAKPTKAEEEELEKERLKKDDRDEL